MYVCEEQISYMYVLVCIDQSLRCRLILHEMSSDFCYLILECSTSYYTVGINKLGIYISFSVFCFVYLHPKWKENNGLNAGGLNDH